MSSSPLTIATAHSYVSAAVRANGREIRSLMRQARSGGASLAHFPEGAISGYTKSQIKDWGSVDWGALGDELRRTAALAGESGLWVVFACNHRLTPPHRPHNSLYVVSDRDELVTRYDNHVAYFHATYADDPQPEWGRDLVLLETRKVEGEEEWSGHLAGTSFIFSHQANLSTLEGDSRFFFDDCLTPQAQGTGTEEWGGGGDYWGGRNMTLPFSGHPVGAASANLAANDEDKIESAYRFLLADVMPFGKNARICLEHAGGDARAGTPHEAASARTAGGVGPIDRLTQRPRDKKSSCGQSRGGP